MARYVVTSLGDEVQPQPSFLKGLGASVAEGVAKIPAQAFDIASSLSQATLPAGQPALSPQQSQSLQLTPQVEALFEPYKSTAQGLSGSAERFTQNAAEALPSFLIGGLNNPSKIANFANAAAMAVGSEAGKQVGKYFNLGKMGQFISSIIGSSIGGAALTPFNLSKQAKSEYNTFSNSIPKGGFIVPENTKRVARKITKSLIPEDRKWFTDNIEPEIKNIIEAPKFHIGPAWSKKKYLEKIIRQSKTGSPEAKGAADTIADAIIDDIVEAGKNYPGMKIQSLLNANNIYYGLHNLSPLRRTLRKFINPQSLATAGLGEIAGIAAPLSFLSGIPLKAWTIGAASKGLVEGLEPLLKSGAAAQHAANTTLPALTLGGISAFPQQTTPQQSGRYIISGL